MQENSCLPNYKLFIDSAIAYFHLKSFKIEFKN